MSKARFDATAPLLFLAGSFWATPAFACSSTACSLAGRTDDGHLRAGRVQVELSFRELDQDRRLMGSRPVTVWGAQDPPVLRPRVDFEDRRIVPGYHKEYAARSRFLQIDVGYGLTRRLSVLASLPVFTNRSVDHVFHPRAGAADHAEPSPGSPRQSLDTSGLGDGQLTVRYTVTSRLSAGIGLKLATGRSTLKDEYGKVADPMSQPGSGAVALVSTVQYGGRIGFANTAWFTTASYQRSAASALDYRVGDEAFLAAVAVRPLTSSLSGTFQVKGYHARRSEFMSQELPSTGASVVYCAPGLRWRGPGTVSFYGSVQVPVYQHVNEGQLGVRSIVTLGISRTF
jgi:hypothetical protein